MTSAPNVVDFNLLDLSANAEGEGPPHALGRRLPAMIAALLGAGGVTARHASTTVPLSPAAELAAEGWAVVAGTLDEGKAIELSRRLGPARFLVFGWLGPQERRGMTISLRVLRRGDAAVVLKLAKVFFEEEVAEVALSLARSLAGLVDRAAALTELDVAAVLGTATPAALLNLQEGLDTLIALEGGLAGADPRQALERLLGALELDPRCRTARDLALSTLAAHAGGALQLEPALELARRLVAAATGDEEAVILLARLHLRRQEVGRAVEALCAGRRAAPASVALTKELLRLLRCDVAQLGEADSPLAVLTAAELLAFQGRVETARDLLEAACERSPTDHRVRSLLGGILTQLGDLAAAEAAYRAALELAPEDHALLSSLAVVLSYQGQHSEAEALAKRSVALAPNDPVSRKILRHILDKN